MTTFSKFSHCHFCGSPYPEGAGFPKTCKTCDNTHFKNPICVAVGLVPCEDGLLGIVRGIEPQKGRTALPGGFVDDMETLEIACSRELLEETGVDLPPGVWRYESCYITPQGNLLTFFKADIAPIPVPPFPFTPPEGVPMETLGFEVIRPGCQLAFPSHEAAAEKLLATMAGQAPRKLHAPR